MRRGGAHHHRGRVYGGFREQRGVELHWKGRHLPLEEFFQRKSLLFSSETRRVTGGSEASDLYSQAGLFIEFLKESKFGKERFPRFLELMGRVPRSDLEKIRGVFDQVYGVTIAELEEEFQAYCTKR